MPKITNNSVLFQLVPLDKLQTDSPLTDIRPLSRDDLAQAHDAWAKQFAPTGQSSSIVSQSQPGFFRRALDNRAARKRVDGLVKRYIDGDKAALGELVAMGGDAIDRLCDLATKREQYENILKCAQSVLGEIGDVRVLERLKEVDGGETPEGYRWHVSGTRRLAAMLMKSCTVDQLIDYGEGGYFVVNVVTALGGRDDPRAVDFLIGLLRGERRQHAIDALIENGNQKGIKAVLPFLREDESTFQSRIDKIDPQQLAAVLFEPSVPILFGRAAWVALNKQTFKSVNVFVRALEHPNREVRAEAAWMLGEIGDERAIEALKGKLSDRSASGRLEALGALNNIPNAFTMEELCSLLGDSNDQIRKYAAERVRTGGAEAAKQLVAALMSDDENMQKRAANLLVSHIKKSDAREALLNAWQEGDAAIRARLVDVLEAILGDEGLAMLVGAMDGGDHALRLRIVQCLKKHAGMFRKEPYLPATDALIACLADPHSDMRENAAHALGDMHRKSSLPQAIEPLSGLLDDPEFGVRWAAACALQTTGDPRVTETLSTFLSHDDRLMRSLVIRMLGRIGDEKAVKAIAAYVAAHEESIEVVFGNLNGDIADITMIEVLDNLGSLSAGVFASFERIAREKNLSRTQKIFDDLEAERAREEKLRAEESELRAEIEEQFERVVAEIRDKIAQGMGFGTSVQAAAGGTESYASVSAGQSMRLELRPELRMEMQPDHSLRVDPSESIEEARERMRTLNFLAHHEMGHLIQDEKKIPAPNINTVRFSLLNAEQVKHDANEMVIDKLAIEAARQIYVYGGGDLLLEEDQRAAIAIRAYLTLAGVVLRNHQNGTHPLKPETMARVVAVLMELAKSKDILVRTKKAGLALAENIYNEIVGDQGDGYGEQIDRLVNAYRKIFMRTRLPH